MGKLIDAIETARQAERDARDARDAQAHVVDDLGRKLNRAIKSNGKQVEQTVARIQDELKRAHEQLAELQATWTGWRTATAQAEDALKRVREPRWDARIAELCELVSQTGGAQYMLRGKHGEWSGFDSGHYLLTLTETNARAEQVARFGFDVDIYAPTKVEQWNHETHAVELIWRAAQVNWGSFGAMSVETARDVMTLHALAIDVAEALDHARDAWYAEDMAD